MIASTHIWGKGNVMNGIGDVDRIGFGPFATAAAAVLEYKYLWTGATFVTSGLKRKKGA